ncbi:MAG: ElyC/SanA/YdcF family protein [Candidatus Sulfotelmatobacter sp.]
MLAKTDARRSRAWFWPVIAFLGVLLAIFAAKAGAFLIIDSPQPSDVILVLAGETDRRPQRALQLLGQAYSRRIVLDVPTNSRLYEFTEIQLAERYVHDLPEAAAIGICPIDGLSTRDESKDAEKCLQREGAKRVLIVTSDFHTRRALDVFRRELPTTNSPSPPPATTNNSARAGGVIANGRRFSSTNGYACCGGSSSIGGADKPLHHGGTEARRKPFNNIRTFEDFLRASVPPW